MSGQAAFLNINFRTGSSAGTGTVLAVVESAGVADAIIAEIFPQSFELSGQKITVDSEGLAKGSFIEVGDFDGGEGVILGAKVSSAPGLEIGVAKDGYKIYGMGDATGSAKLDLDVPGLTIKAELIKKTKGSFALDVGGVNTTFSGDYVKKQAEFAFDYQDVSLALGVDKTKTAGHFNIKIDGKEVGAHANVAAKTAGLVLDLESKKFLLEFDGKAKSTEFELKYDDFEFHNMLNLTEKKGFMHFASSVAEVDIEGSREGALFSAASGEYLFHLQSSFVEPTGSLALAFPNHELNGRLESDRGSIFLRKDDFELGLNGKFDASGGNVHLKEGDFTFDLGADASESMGYLTMVHGSKSFATRYEPADTSFVEYKDGNSIYEGRVASGYFKSQVKEGDYHFLLELDKNNIAGQTLFKIPDYSIATAFDASQNLASSRFEIQDISIESGILNDSLSIHYINGGMDFKVAGKEGGSGSVFFADAEKNIATGFSFDIENEAGSIAFQKDDLNIAVEGNKSANTGRVAFALDGDSFTGGLDDSLYVSTLMDDYGFRASRSTDKFSASFTYSDTEISAAKFSGGEQLKVSIPDNTFSLGREGSTIKAGYGQNDLQIGATVGAQEVGFDVTKGDITISASADDQKQVRTDFTKADFGVGVTGDLSSAIYTTNITQNDWTGTIGSALKTDEISLGLSKGDIGVEGTFKTDEKTLEYELGDFSVKGGMEASVPKFDIEFGAAKMNFGSLMAGNIAPATGGNQSPNGAGGIQFESSNLNWSMGSLGAGQSPDLNIQMGSTQFTIQPITTGNVCNLDLKRDNNPVAFLGNTFDETVNGNRLRVALNPDDSKNIIVETSDVSVDVTYKCGELPEFAVNNGGKQYIFKVKRDEVQLTYEDNEFAYLKSNKELKIQKGSEYLFKVNNESLETDLDGYYVNASNDEVSAGTGQTYLKLSEDQIAVHADDKFVEIHSDDTYLVQVDANKNIALTATSVELNIDSKRLFADENTLSAADTQESFAVMLSQDSLSIQKDQYKIFAASQQVKFNKGSDYVEVTNESLAAKYSDKELKVTADKKVSYKDNDRELIASKESLYLDYEGKILEVAQDLVRLELASDKKFLVKKDLLSGQYEQHKVDLTDPLGSPGFAYSDNDNSLGLSQTEASILVSGKGVSVGEDKLQFNYDDNFIRFTEADMALKYERYEGRFAGFDDLYITNGIQDFAIEGTKLSASIDEKNSIKAVLDPNAPELELIHDETRLGLSPEKAEFDYEGMHYGMGKVEYIRVNEIGKEDEGFVFTENGITYLFGPNRSITAAPSKDYLKLNYDDKEVAFTDKYDLRFTMDKYVTTLHKDLSVDFVADKTHSVELNKSKYMVGYTYLPENIYLRLQRFEDNYIGLIGGKDKYAGFVKPAKDKSIEIGGRIDGLGQASVMVNPDKDIGIKLLQGTDNFVKVGVDKAKTLDLAHIKIKGADIINYGGEVDAFGEGMEGISAVGGDAPTHISVLTEKAGGWAVGGVKFRRTIGKDLAFVAQGRIQTGLTIPLLCGDIPFGAELKPGVFRFKIADKNDYAGLSLLCLPGISLYSETGYADLYFDATGNAAEMGMGVGYKVETGFKGGFSVDILTCELGVSVDVGAHLHFGGKAHMSIPYSGTEAPEVQFGPMFAELHAHASLSAHACSYSFSASASITGRLELEGGTSGASAEGTASGHMSVCGLSKSFEFNAKVSI